MKLLTCAYLIATFLVAYLPQNSAGQTRKSGGDCPDCQIWDSNLHDCVDDSKGSFCPGGKCCDGVCIQINPITQTITLFDEKALEGILSKIPRMDGSGSITYSLSYDLCTENCSEGEVKSFAGAISASSEGAGMIPGPEVPLAWGVTARAKLVVDAGVTITGSGIVGPCPDHAKHCFSGTVEGTLGVGGELCLVKCDTVLDLSLVGSMNIGAGIELCSDGSVSGVVNPGSLVGTATLEVFDKPVWSGQVTLWSAQG